MGTAAVVLEGKDEFKFRQPKLLSNGGKMFASLQTNNIIITQYFPWAN